MRGLQPLKPHALAYDKPLCASLDGLPLCGVLPATATMTGGLTLGYREAVALTDSVQFSVGERVACLHHLGGRQLKQDVELGLECVRHRT